jgi:hypothetical protein
MKFDGWERGMKFDGPERKQDRLAIEKYVADKLRTAPSDRIELAGTFVDREGFIVEDGHPQAGCMLLSCQGGYEDVEREMVVLGAVTEMLSPSSYFRELVASRAAELDAQEQGIAVKTFDVEAAQLSASKVREKMLGRGFRHYKGGVYRVTDVVVNEATGTTLVIYTSLNKGYRCMGSRATQPGDVAEYERCRAIIMDAMEAPTPNWVPNYARDYGKGAAGQ